MSFLKYVDQIGRVEFSIEVRITEERVEFLLDKVFAILKVDNAIHVAVKLNVLTATANGVGHAVDRIDIASGRFASQASDLLVVGVEHDVIFDFTVVGRTKRWQSRISAKAEACVNWIVVITHRSIARQRHDASICADVSSYMFGHVVPNSVGIEVEPSIQISVDRADDVVFKRLPGHDRSDKEDSVFIVNAIRVVAVRIRCGLPIVIRIDSLA